MGNRAHSRSLQGGTNSQTQLRYYSGLWVEFGFPETDGRSRVETRVKTKVKTPAEILDYFRENPDDSLAEVASAIGKSLSAVERASSKLAKEGKLRFVGPRKGGH